MSLVTDFLCHARDKIPRCLGIQFVARMRDDQDYAREYAQCLPFLVDNMGSAFRPHTSAQGYVNSFEQEKALVEALFALQGVEPGFGFTLSGSTLTVLNAIYIARQVLTIQAQSDVEAGEQEAKAGSPAAPRRIACFYRDDAHFSTRNAAEICGVTPVSIRTVDDYGALDLVNLAHKAARHASDSIILVVAAGTCRTAFVDDVDQVVDVLANTHNVATQVYVHLDSALGGTHLPLLQSYTSARLSNKHVSSTNISMHKFLAVPAPVSALLLKQRVVDLLQPHARYAECPAMFVKTIAGSRDGFATLMAANELAKVLANRDAAVARLRASLSLARWFCAQCNECGLAAVLTKPTCLPCVYFPCAPPAEVCAKYSMPVFMVDKTSKRTASHIFVMQHVTREMLNEFLVDVRDVHV